MSGFRLLGLACVVCVAACSGAGGTAPLDASSAGGIPDHTVMYAASPITILGLPGEIASTPPSVRIAVSATGQPVRGVSVSFTFSDGRGPSYSTVTNAKGLAVLENLRFDNRPGQYSITASVAGVDSVVFSAYSVGGKLVATYDLQRPGAVVSGGHYQLFDDGTYRQGYNRGGEQTQWNGREPFFRRSEGKIEFYVSAASSGGSEFYASRNYLFAVGTLTGDTMKVVYQDPVDFEDEEYILAK
jgi:hypothetical protein